MITCWTCWTSVPNRKNTLPKGWVSDFGAFGAVATCPQCVALPIKVLA